MDSALNAISEQQKQSWNKFSGGWKKWDELTMDFMAPVRNAMIAAIHPAGADVVLDIAAGTGEPGLTIAQMLDTGKVVITDLAEDMLTVAKENAAKRNITNVEVLACDVSSIPFPDNYFDAISCRYGFMFFPDMQLAANEMFRVLKPGGRITTAVWDIVDKNFWVTAIMGVINKNLQSTPPPPGAPGMFRCSAPGLMKGIFENAGFANVQEQHVASALNAGTLERYWEMMTEVAAPVVGALSKADIATQEKIKAEVFEAVSQRYPEGNISIAAGSILISASKS